MYQVSLYCSPTTCECLSEEYLELGALSVSIFEHEDGSKKRLCILADDKSWFKTVGVLEKPRRLKKSEWEYQYEQSLTVQTLIPGVEIESVIAKKNHTQQPKTGNLRLKMDLRGAFGDGTHPTTQLCAKLLRDLISDRMPTSLADLGTGTGVLAILAAKWGVSTVYAMDVELTAIKRTKRNVKLNQVKVKVEQADLATATPSHYFECVVANLHSELISRCLPKIKAWVKPEGLVIVSGIASKWKPEILQVFKRENLSVLQINHHQDWWAIGAKVEKNTKRKDRCLTPF